VDADALPAEGLAPARLSYFNLHGIEDGPEWYGQRSAGDPGSAPEYPVALRPSDVVNSGRAPLVVFSEACYGANVLGKTVADALCLRFLDSGTRALVGSTKIAYGSVGTPLIGADLLGQFFWRNVNSALPVGEAQEVVPIQRPAQALTVEHRVVAYRGRHAPVGVDIGEVELAPILEQAMHAAQHRVLVGRKVDHAVGHDYIKTARFQLEFVQALDIALQEAHIGVTEGT